MLKRYRVMTVVGDRYAGEWPAEQFRQRGVNFEHSDRTKSQIYLDFLLQVNSRSVDLLDDKRLIAQLMGLERRVTPGGRDAVDHGPGQHDDIANVVAGALCLVPSRSIVPAWMSHGKPAYTDDSDWDPFEPTESDPFDMHYH